MDGEQGKMRLSLQLKLTAWLAVSILVMALAAGVFAFYSSFSWALEFQDDQLRQVAALINLHDLPPVHGQLRDPVPGTDPDSELIVQFVPGDSTHALPAAPNTLGLTAGMKDGLQTIKADGEKWRVFIRPLDSGPRIAVAQQTASRDEVARDGAIRTLMPFLFLIPVLSLIVGMLVRGTFRPVKLLAADIDGRSENDLHPVSDDRLPTEIRPFVVAINRLLSRVASSVAAQRRFLADAAHELRSPMTALSLQAERLASVDMPAPARERLGTLRTGVHRTRALLDQLLALAQAQETIDRSAPPVMLWNVLRKVIEDMLPLAEAKKIDLGIKEATDVRVAARAIDLQILVKNLVENAIRYTPEGGVVNLSARAEGGRAILLVEDTGPGIPAGERSRVFDPFYRILGSDIEGSGLGLSIVKSIADGIGATVALENIADADGVQDAGLRVTVKFPNAAG
ncbi:two-component sensor histidine kinase [Oxalobacteraceae bacterium CAVE-383]|nr:two-component sensor histidine kinase [Oxalobacteraceae bacterium CAVE-383]